MTKISSEDALLDEALKSPEMAPFAIFNIDITSIIDPSTGLPMYPELCAASNGPVWLWEIRSNGGNEVDHQRDDSQAAAVAHKLRVEEYAARVARGEPLFEGDEDDTKGVVLEPATTPPDEWERFWGGESPTQKMDHWTREE